MTSLEVYAHTGTVKSPEESLATTPADYTLVDLVNDYFIWTGDIFKSYNKRISRL